MEELSYIGSDSSLKYCNLSLCRRRFFPCFVLGVDIVLLVLSYFCRFQYWAQQSSQCSHSFNYGHVMHWLRATPRLASLI